jgi:hypothetical protein
MRSAIVVVLLAACGGRQASPSSTSSSELSNQVGATEQPTRDSTLRVTGVVPSHGDPQGGTSVRIVGGGFLATVRAMQIYFGNRQATIRRIENEEIFVEAPAGKVGDIVDVLLIFEPGGQMKLPRAFAFIASPTPP